MTFFFRPGPMHTESLPGAEGLATFHIVLILDAALEGQLDFVGGNVGSGKSSRWRNADRGVRSVEGVRVCEQERVPDKVIDEQ